MVGLETEEGPVNEGLENRASAGTGRSDADSWASTEQVLVEAFTAWPSDDGAIGLFSSML
jgi:hypothetical protein